MWILFLKTKFTVKEKSWREKRSYFKDFHGNHDIMGFIDKIIILLLQSSDSTAILGSFSHYLVEPDFKMN